MFLTIVFALLALWLVGFIVFHVAGFIVHVLLVVAVIMILMRIIRGK